MTSVGEAFITLRPDTKGFGAEADRSIGAPLKKIALAAAAGFAAAGAASVFAIGKLGMAYQDNLNMLQAVTGATAGEMDKMRATAKALGNDLTLPGTSAASAAAAMVELGKAGLSVNDTLTASKGVLQLAAAGNISEAQAAEIAANALNSFHLEGKEATRVADLLAAAANASSSEVTDLAQGFSMASAVFSNAGYSITDLTTAMGLLANAGIKGSDAGTSLKQMLLQLAAPSQTAVNNMEKYGFFAYDTAGKLKPLTELMAHLGDVTKDMTQQQRDFFVATVFGSDAMRAVTVLSTAGAAGMEKMTAAVSKAGAAQELSAARTKGLKGAIDALKSVMETLAITIFEKVEPRLSQFARWLGEELPGAIDKSSKFFNENLAPVLSVLAAILVEKLIPTLVDLVTKLAAVSSWIAEHKPALIALSVLVGTVLVSAFIAWTIRTIAATAALIAHGVAVVADNIKLVILSASIVYHAAMVALATIAVGVLTAAQWALNIAMTANPIGLVIAALVALGVGLVVAYQKVGWFHDFIDNLWQLLQATFHWVQDNWKLLLVILTGPFGLAALAIAEHWDTIKNGFTAVRNWISDRVDDIGRILPRVYDFIVDPFKRAFEKVKGLYEDTIGRIPGIGGILQGAVNTVLPGSGFLPFGANGFRNFQGGPAVINEHRGGELLDIPRGSNLYTMGETNEIAGLLRLLLSATERQNSTMVRLART